MYTYRIPGESRNYDSLEALLSNLRVRFGLLIAVSFSEWPIQVELIGAVVTVERSQDDENLENELTTRDSVVSCKCPSNALHG